MNELDWTKMKVYRCSSCGLLFAVDLERADEFDGIYAPTCPLCEQYGDDLVTPIGEGHLGMPRGSKPE